MKSDILKKLETLLETENILSVQREFKQISAQFKSLVAHGIADIDESEEDHEDDEHDDAVHSKNKNEDVQDATERSEEVISTEKSDFKSASPDDPESNKHVDSDLELKKEVTTTEKVETQPESEGAAKETSEQEAIVIHDSQIVEDAKTELKTKPENEESTIEEQSVSESSNETKEEASEKDQLTEESAVTTEETEQDTVQKDQKTEETDQKSDTQKDASGQTLESESVEFMTMAEAIEKFNALTAKFKEKSDKQREAKIREEKETVITAKHLLDELQSLVENEENIAKAFSGFNAIQDKWKSLPKVSNDAYRDLNAEYNKYAEKFFYNINIYKELKELDLKHNLEQKLLVLEDQRKLEGMNDIRRMEVEVRLNQDRWNEIGPTFKEEWDKVKDEFWNTTRNIYKKIQDFYNQRREQQNKNLELKQELLDKVNQINSLEITSQKKWQEKTKKVIEIQKEWKMIGYVPKDKTGVWKEYRKASDSFFDKKRALYKDVRDQQNANKEQKMELLRQAEELKDNEDWNTTSAALIRLQKEWKTIGPAHQRDENRMWRKFRQACDHFFQKRKSHRSEEAVEFENNLKAKRELIGEMEKFKPFADRNANIEALKEFAERWRNIGHVAFKLKDKVNKDYKKILDEEYGLLKIDRKEKEKIRFEQKLEDIKETDNNDYLIRKEQDNIRAKISKLNNEAIQLENNIGFFANSKGAEKLKAEVERKIEKVKNEIEELKERLTMLREAI